MTAPQPPIVQADGSIVEPVKANTKRQTPNVYTPEEILKWETQSSIPGSGQWYLARSRSRPRENRFVLAWKVLTGQYDALKWLG